MKTAVILAARKERDSEIPYPLLPFDDKGNTLLDRTITILEACGIERIILVIGYRKEAFEKYAAKGVILVENKDYSFTSSMESLSLAAPYVEEEFLLIESDTFFEKTVIDQLVNVRAGNCFSLAEESGSGDEAFAEVKSGFVNKISKDIHQLCNVAGEMIGVSKVSADTYQTMLKRYAQSTNRQLNYEYLFLDSTELVDRHFLKFKDLIWGEVDSAEDLEKLRHYIYPKLKCKENPYEKENLYAHLRNIFPDQEIDERWIIEKVGGLSNKNFKVCDPSGKTYVLRVPGIGAEGMVERSYEKINGMIGCRLGINPPILYFNETTGIKLAEFVKNAETLTSGSIQRMSNMIQVADILKSLHHSKVRLANEFNIFSEIIKYEKLLEKAGGKMYSGYESVREKIFGLASLLNRFGVEVQPCHNDLLYDNFLKDENGRMYLIDWEYSGMNDPMADIAALFLEANYSDENSDYLLDRYFDGKVPSNAKPKILVYEVLWDYLWSIWTCIREAKGDDFGTYGHDRYNRAVKNLLKITQ